jgi:large subunit ribosomal protein L21e
MAQKSHGSRHGTRKKFAKGGEDSLSVNDHMKQFEEGQKVVVEFNPSVQEGRVHSRFHGRTAEVTGHQGRAVRIELDDGGKHKKLFVRPVHLKEASE